MCFNVQIHRMGFSVTTLKCAYSFIYELYDGIRYVTQTKQATNTLNQATTKKKHIRLSNPFFGWVAYQHYS